MTSSGNEIAAGSLKSIDINSAVEHSLMDDLRKSYPLEDMRLILENISENWDLDGIVNCSRSQSASSCSQVQSQKSIDQSIDVLIVDY